MNEAIKLIAKPRVAIIIASNLYMAPYVNYYTEILDQNDIPYDVISWNRLGVEEAGAQALTLKESKSRFGRIFEYFRYRRFVKSKLENVKYDKVVVFTIFNTLLLFPYLKEKYRHNYVFDIRDYSVALKYVRKRFTEAIQNAALVVISSNGYKQWLPQRIPYLIRHNTNVRDPQPMKAAIKDKGRYKILTIGAIGYYEANRAMIESLADDPMFEVEFVGSGYAEQGLKDFVFSRGIANVSFLGRYAKADEPKFLEGAALISILINDTINSVTCMSNRFYLSLVYGIPMMVDENTEQARWVEKYNLGVVIDHKLSIKEQILQYIHAFDHESFDAGRRTCLQLIQRDIQVFEAEFKEYLER